MSIKSRKVALASAIFSMAVLASCGGGGSSSSTSPSTPPPSTPPGPTTVAKVLAQTWTGFYSGNSFQIRVCDLKSDGTISCGDDLNPSADTTFNYQYEFSNGNVLLKGSDNKAYYFDATAGTLNKLTNGKDVAGNAVKDANGNPVQLDLTTAVFVDKNPNFYIYNIGVSDVVITKSGNYVQKTSTGGNISEFYMGDNSNFVVVTESGHTYRIDASGNVVEIKDGTTSIEFQTPLAKVGDNILVQASNNAVYLLKDDGTLVKIDGTTFGGSIAGSGEAQMVKVGNDFYIAVRDGTNLYYYKNSTQSSNSPVTLPAGADVSYYALDGNGNVYYYDGSNVRAITTGLIASSNGQAVPSFGGLIGTSAGVIAKGKDTNNNNASYLLSISGNNIVSTISVNPDLFNAVDTCVTAKIPTNLGKVNGEGTSQIMCVDGTTAKFSWITYNSGYNGKQLAPITGFGSYTDVEFYGNNAVVYDNTNKTEICSVGSTASTCTAGLTVQGVVKKYNNILAMVASGTLSIGDLLAGTSNTIFTFTGSPTVTPGNVSADVTMAAIVKSTVDSPCNLIWGVGNQVILYNNGTINKYTYKSNDLCFFGGLLRLYK
jgi:hypothetical protein